MGETGICQMTPFEHIAAWQNMFTSTPQPLVALALLLLIALFAPRFIFNDFLPKKEPARRIVFYTPPNIGVFDSLKLAFARGIINPKVF